MSPLNIHITDGVITITAEDGTIVSIDRTTGAVQPKRAEPTKATDRIRARLHPTATSVQVTPRWTVKVGDPIMGQHKKGGRKFRTKVNDIVTEHGTTYVRVCDPRNGGTYLLGLDRIAKAR